MEQNVSSIKYKRVLNFVPVRVVDNVFAARRRQKYTPKTIVDIYSRSSFPSSVKNRNEFNDYDYLHKLNKDEKDWLFRFHREYLNADFKHAGELIHKTRSLRLECYTMNNKRNADIYSNARGVLKLEFLGDKVFKLVDDKFYFYERNYNESIGIIEESD